MLEDIILREIGTMTRAIHSIVEEQFTSLNLQRGQSIFLTRICENPGLTFFELNKMLLMNKTTTSKVVKKLIKEELIIKETNPQDKRSYKLFPTEKAKEIYKIIIEEENRITRQTYKDFTNEEKKIALKIVQKMKENVEQDWNRLKG